MSDKLRNYSLKDLLKQGKVRIPKIQRDYAQGRRNQNVDEIRKVFVHSLLLVAKGQRPAAELDFVYGSNRDGAFEPLDGQQRLTTLFLLHWMLGEDLSVPGDKKHSVFTYETRNTSDEFCNELVQHGAWQFVKEARDKDKEARDKGSVPSEMIRNRDWFKYEWKHDPTILSMLVMIDAIYQEMGDVQEDDLKTWRENLEHITFHLLNLGDFGLSDELFVKMNARGKQLSDFDKLKSTLEEELQTQQKETNEQGIQLATADDEENWRSLMDGAWIDLFWHKYARQTIIDSVSAKPEAGKKKCLEAAKSSEQHFKKLLLRLIALQLFENENTPDSLSDAAYHLDDPEINDLLFEYADSLTELRSDDQHIVSEGTVTLNFRQLIQDVNSLIYKDDNGIYYEISYLLPRISHIADNELSVFDEFLLDNVSNDVKMTFYALLLFLRKFPAAKTRKEGDGREAWHFDIAAHKPWICNLEAWVRVARNILLYENTNQRIDRIQYCKEAAMSLKQMVADLAKYVSEQGIDVEADGYAVTKFLNSSDTTYRWLDNQSLAEERLKASLVLEDEAWKSTLDSIEQHPYLWGQVRLLSWSGKQLDAFKEYGARLTELLDCIEKNEKSARDYYAAMLVLVPDCWRASNRLYRYDNKDRDNSLKRYLRDKVGQYCGVNFKTMIDHWNGQYQGLSAEDFLLSVLKKDIKADCPQWIRCVAKYPDILAWACEKRVFEQRRHVILAQYKTMNSHCFDPILVYLWHLCEGKKKCTLYDSKSEHGHAFELEAAGHEYFVEWADADGLYRITTDGGVPAIYSPEDTVSFMEGVI